MYACVRLCFILCAYSAFVHKALLFSAYALMFTSHKGCTALFCTPVARCFLCIRIRNLLKPPLPWLCFRNSCLWCASLLPGAMLPWDFEQRPRVSISQATCVADRFFLGGPSSLRGFRTKGVGPTDVRRPPGTTQMVNCIGSIAQRAIERSWRKEAQWLGANAWMCFSRM